MLFTKFTSAITSMTLIKLTKITNFIYTSDAYNVK